MKAQRMAHKTEASSVLEMHISTFKKLTETKTY